MDVDLLRSHDDRRKRRDGKTHIENCGVHVVAGFHRTYMSNFIRDGKSGGCAIGLPPDNLGFRLVREPKGFLG